MSLEAVHEAPAPVELQLVAMLDPDQTREAVHSRLSPETNTLRRIVLTAQHEADDPDCVRVRIPKNRSAVALEIVLRELRDLTWVIKKEFTKNGEEDSILLTRPTDRRNF